MTPNQFVRLYLDFLVFLFGAIVGSFLNVCIYRMPRNLSVVSPPSACPHCGTHIRWYHNIPLFTWLFIGGKCRYCGAKITSRYFFVELLTAVAFLTVWLRFVVWQPFDMWFPAIYWTLIAGFIAATFIDFEHFIIPDEITLGGVAVGFVFSFLCPQLMGESLHWRGALYSFLGLLCGGGVLFAVVELGKVMFGKRKVPLTPGEIVRILDQKLVVGQEEVPWEDLFARDSDRITLQAITLKFGEQTFENAKVVVSDTTLYVNDQPYELSVTGPIEATGEMIVLPREAMGLGDVKLLAAIGAFLGWRATLFTIFSSSILGGIIGGTLLLTKKANWQGRIPYGPYLVVGALLWLFYGNDLMDWYMRFMRG
jgi:leader peptidase (prepilin peptidase)/N-methyltransferase